MFVDHELAEPSPPPAEPASLNLERLRAFVAAAKEKDDLEAKLKVVKKQLSELEPAILEQFIDSGIQNTKVDGRVVYIQREIFASPTSGDGSEEDGDARAKVAEALAQTEYASLSKLNYNANSLNAAVREIARELEATCDAENKLLDEETVRNALPEPLRDLLKITFSQKLRSRKG